MGNKAIVNGNKLVYTLGSAMWLTWFLFEGGSREDGLVDSLCIERHIVRASHVINPKLFVCLWEVIDADVGGQARVQTAGWSIPEEPRAEPPSMAIWHGHVPCHGVDDVTDAGWVVFLWSMFAILSWWWRAVVG